MRAPILFCNIVLPNELQCKLNVPGLSHDGRLYTSPAAQRSVLVENLRSTGTKGRQGGSKVSMIQDIEEFCPKLHAGFLADCEVLVQREVEVKQLWTVYAIAAGIPQEVRARPREVRVRQRALPDKRYTTRGDLRSRLRQRVALRVDVTEEDPAGIAFEIVVYRIASGHAARNGECVRAGVLNTKRVSADKRSRRNAAIHLDNAAQLPSTQQRCGRPVERLRHGQLPDRIDGRTVPDIEICWSVADVGGEPEPARDRVRKCIAGDGRGTVIHGFAVRVRTSELEAAAHPLLDIELKTFV